MSVHRRKDGRIFVAYRDKKTGKIKQKMFGRGLDAESKANGFNDSLKLRPYEKRTPASPFFYELVEGYIDAKIGDMPKTSTDNLVWKMQGIIYKELGHLEAIKITPRRLDLYVKKRLKSNVYVRTGPKDNPKLKVVLGKDGKPKTVKTTTIHRELSDIQAVLNWAVERRYLTYNPVAKYKKPRRDDEIINPPTDTETRKLLENSPDHLIKTIVLAYYTGIRPGATELFKLRYENIDFDAEIIFVRSSKKGGARFRQIPIHEEFYPILKEWAMSNGSPGGPIIHWKGQPVQSIDSAFRTAKKKAGITRRLRPYDFRHAFATRILRSRGDLKSTSQMLGHTRTDTTTRIYQHTDIELHRDTINLLPPIQNVLTKKETPKPDE